MTSLRAGKVLLAFTLWYNTWFIVSALKYSWRMKEIDRKRTKLVESGTVSFNLIRLVVENVVTQDNYLKCFLKI